MAMIRLGEIAYARSGDKGSGANVGVLARGPEVYAFLCDALSADRVQEFFHPLNVGRVVRYELPNLRSLNFILPAVLDGGGSLSLRIDAQGKALGQSLLELTLEASEDWIDRLRRDVEVSDQKA